MIAYIQHYHTGTRFVDFTTDLDVALYFACSEKFEKDAALFVWNYSPHSAEWYTTCIQTELILIKEDKITVQDFSERIIKKHPWISNKMTDENFVNSDLNAAIVSFLEHGFVAVPTGISKKNNLRMQRQKGCFVICGVKFEPELDSCLYRRFSSYAGKNEFYPHSVVIPNSLERGNSLVKIIIPKELKWEIFLCLQGKGITKEYLLPGME